MPEACLFSTDWPGDGTPGGQATNLLYTQTATTNPITNYVYLQGSPMSPCVNSPIGGGVNDSNPRLRMWGCYMGTLRFDAFEIIERDLQLPPYLMQIPSFAANEAISQQQYDVVFHFDLHDPPRSPGISQSEFTIPTTPVAAIVNQAYRGHNLVPFAGDGQFYAIVSRNNVAGTNTTGTIFNYADFSDLFKVQ